MGKDAMSVTMTTTPVRPSRRTAHDHGPDGRGREAALLMRYHQHKDLEAREALIERFLPVARDLARRFVDTGEPLDDLAQVAALALIKAVDRFDPTRGTEFLSYAAPTIMGELKRHIRDKGWALHVPRGLQERALTVSHATEALEKQLRRSPTPREVAQAIGCRVEEVLEAQEAAATYAAASLDAPAAGHDEVVGLVEVLGDDDPSYALVDDRDAVTRGCRMLPDIDRELIKLRFAHDLSQREIGKRVGYSQMHVSRLLRRALDQLHAAATAG